MTSVGTGVAADARGAWIMATAATATWTWKRIAPFDAHRGALFNLRVTTSNEQEIQGQKRPADAGTHELAARVVEAVDASARYLASDAARRAIALDPYWPKWDSPWWHMLALFELGEAQRIPQATAQAMAARLDAMPFKIFPLRPEDIPPGIDKYRETFCHCALGSMHQVLAACGIDVDRELPWVETWIVRYQMADGGLNCDGEAYLQTQECASSMVGTIAAFEAMLGGDPGRWGHDHAAFVARAAGFLVEREVRLGSRSSFNAEERERERGWRDLCLPRFYFYDVLRGLSALVRWAEKVEAELPAAAVESVTTELCTRFPDGVVVTGRQSFAESTTRAPDANGVWRRQPSSTFPLLDAVSVVGAPSPWLTRSWAETRAGLLRARD